MHFLCARRPESVQSAGLDDNLREPHLTVPGDETPGVKWLAQGGAQGGAQNVCSGSPGVRHSGQAGYDSLSHTHTHTHTQTHRCIHAHTNTETHRHITCTTSAHTYTRAHRRACMHTHTHARRRCTPSHLHVHTCTGTGTLGQGPCHASQPLSLFRSNILLAAFASPWPRCLRHLIRLRTGGRGHTLLKIIVIILANGVKGNFLPRGNPLI